MKNLLPPLSKALQITQGDRIALTGGGGKTTILYTLAEENPFNQGLFTTTTKMYDPADSPHPFHRIMSIDEDEHKVGGQYPRPSQEQECCFIFSGKDPRDSKKVLGLSNKLIESWKCMKEWPILLIEADGAAGKPIKAPRLGEPVIPGCVNKVFGCIGLDALGKPLSSRWIHRYDLFRERFCTPLQKRIDPEVIKNLIIHPRGLFQNAPENSEKWVILNKMDSLAPGENPEILLKYLKKEVPAVQFLMISLHRRQVVIHRR